MVGVAGLAAGFILALLPVGVSSGFGPPVGCDPSGTAVVGGGSAVGLGHYVSAVEVWLIPDSVDAPRTDTTNYDTSGLESTCRHAAQDQMIPAVTLSAAALLLLGFRRTITRFASASPVRIRRAQGPPEVRPGP